jgi:tetratricopeptide (TPR) repeat protein
MNHNLSSRRRFRPLLGRYFAVALMVAGLAYPLRALAQSEVHGIDRVQFVSLTPMKPRPEDELDTLRLGAEVEYKLDSVQHALLALLLFEDNAADPVPGITDSVEVGQGTGRTALTVAYSPRPDVRTLSTFVGLFREDKTLITYVATTPFSLGPWRGRAAFDDGMSARQAGDYARAVDEFSTAVRLSPDTGGYYYWKADSLLQLGRVDEAIAGYDRALELTPGDSPSLIGRGVAWLWKHEWQPAIDDLSAAIDRGGAAEAQLAWAHRARGVAYTATDRRGEALADYETYLAMDPGASDRDEVERLIQALQ